MANDQTKDFILANNPDMTVEEMAAGMNDIPEVLQSLNFEGYLKVVKTDEVQLVITRLSLPGEKAGIVNSTI